MPWHRPLIMLFCAWHIVAVGVLSIAETLRGPVPEYLVENVEPGYRFYYRTLFNQRQAWRMFANPTRTVVYYVIEAQENGAWSEQAVINYDYFGWRRRAHNLKTIRNVDDREGARGDAMREAYAQTFCGRLALPPGMPVRMRRVSMVLPKNDTEPTQEWWSTWEPKWNDKIAIQTTCPSAS